jgi:hypothetical protein
MVRSITIMTALSVEMTCRLKKETTEMHPTLTEENIDAIIQEGCHLINAGNAPEVVIKNQTVKLGMLLLNEIEFFGRAPAYHLAVAKLERSLQV